MFRRLVMWLNQEWRNKTLNEPDENVYERERIRHEEKVALERRLEVVKAKVLSRRPREQDVLND